MASRHNEVKASEEDEEGGASKAADGEPPPIGSMSSSSITGLSRLNASKLLPSYSGALDWLRRHQEELDTVAHLVDIYPNLLLEDEMSGLRNLLQEAGQQQQQQQRKIAWQRASRENVDDDDDDDDKTASNSLEEFTTGESRPSSVYGNGNDRRVTSDLYDEDYPKINSVFVCAAYVLSISECTAMERLVAALTPFCFVRCCLPESMEDSYAADYYDSIVGCDVFIFILNKKTLRSTFALQHLAVAVSYQVPVVCVRGPSYKLPKPIFEELSSSGLFSGSDQVSSPSSLLDTPPRGHSSSDHLTKHGDEDRLDTARSCRSLPTDRERMVAQIQFMTRFIEEGYRDSVVYSLGFHDACIGKLFGRLSDYLGDAFLDFEVFRSNVAGVGHHHQTSRSNVGPLPPLKNGILQNSAVNKSSSSADFYVSRPKRVSSQSESLNSAPSGDLKRSSSEHFEVKRSVVRRGGGRERRQPSSPDYSRTSRRSPLIHPTQYLVFPADRHVTSVPYTVRFPSNKFEQQDSGYTGSPPSPLSSPDSLLSSPYDYGQVKLGIVYRSTESTPRNQTPESKQSETRRKSSGRVKSRTSLASSSSRSSSKTSTPDSVLSRSNQQIKKPPSRVDMTSLMKTISPEISDSISYSSSVSLPKKSGAKGTKKFAPIKNSRNTRSTAVVAKMRPKVSMKVATVTLRYNL